MKKNLGIIIGLIAIFWVVVTIFGKYNSNNILSDQASFEIFVDKGSFDIDKYFNLPQGTCEKEEYKLVCILPVEVSGFKPNYAPIRTDIKNIDCNASYSKEKNIKYESYELKDLDFQLVLVKKYANLMTLNSPLGTNSIIAQQYISYKYSKGKINRLIVSVAGIDEYCK